MERMVPQLVEAVAELCRAVEKEEALEAELAAKPTDPTRKPHRRIDPLRFLAMQLLRTNPATAETPPADDPKFPIYNEVLGQVLDGVLAREEE